MAAVIVTLLPVALGATVLVPAEFREIVNGADIIVYGRVSSTRARWSDDRKHVDTLVTLQAGTYLKGVRGETLVVRGARRHDRALHERDRRRAEFNAGDEAVFFLNTRGRELPAIFGLNQGVFRVSIEGASRRRIVTPPLMARGSGPETVVRGDPARRPVPLETFGAQVQSVLAETGRAAAMRRAASREPRSLAIVLLPLVVAASSSPRRRCSAI